ncbi:MAG: methyltransferase domain-containing protein [Caldilineaceae bacterium]
MLAVAKQAAMQAGLQIQFRQQRLDQPLAELPDSFVLVLSALVLCHVEDLALIAREAYRVLTPGGHFLVTDFHPAVIAAGWRTQFVNDDGAFLLPTARHTVDDYLGALCAAGFQIERVQEGLVREVPDGAFPAELVAKDGDKPFCLVILATKP